MEFRKCWWCGISIATGEFDSHMWLVHYQEKEDTSRLTWLPFGDSIMNTVEHGKITGRYVCPNCGYAFQKDAFYTHIRKCIHD